jgi:hypothetical protein
MCHEISALKLRILESEKEEKEDKKEKEVLVSDIKMSVGLYNWLIINSSSDTIEYDGKSIRLPHGYYNASSFISMMNRIADIPFRCAKSIVTNKIKFTKKVLDCSGTFIDKFVEDGKLLHTFGEPSEHGIYQYIRVVIADRMMVLTRQRDNIFTLNSTFSPEICTDGLMIQFIDYKGIVIGIDKLKYDIICKIEPTI